MNDVMKTYLAKSGKLFKIGKSKNPLLRIQSMKTANPDIRLIAYGSSVDEETLHFRYRNQRVKGEWLKIRSRDVQNIIRLLVNEYDNTMNTVKKYSLQGKVGM